MLYSVSVLLCVLSPPGGASVLHVYIRCVVYNKRILYGGAAGASYVLRKHHIGDEDGINTPSYLQHRVSSGSAPP